jgi:CrcB protein
MNATNLLLAALGGALGSVLRVLGSAAVGAWLPSVRLPWGTMLVNVTGSLAIGWLMGRFAGETAADERWRSLLVVGVCGGFTTFSAFSWQTFDLFQKNQPGAAFANVMLSVVLCLAATWLGWRLAR